MSPKRQKEVEVELAIRKEREFHTQSEFDALGTKEGDNV